MAKAQDKKKSKNKPKNRGASAQGTPKKSSASSSRPTTTSPTDLLSQATQLVSEGQPNLALPLAQSALSALRASHGNLSPLTLPALSLVSEIQLELGDAPSAYKSFSAAVEIDPDGAVPDAQGGGADKFLWLAQLDETGGQESLKWFEKAVACLEREVGELEGKAGQHDGDLDARAELEEKRLKLAHALCGMCELWMTDLSFDDAAAETQCEALVTRALLLAPDDAQTLQTLASIRLSQQRLADAQAALERSVALFRDLPPNHPLVPEFAARIALARTLMEADMEDLALDVCENLVGEDDQSIEAWYLGGWCQWLMVPDNKGSQGGGGDEEMEEDGDDNDTNTINKAAEEGNNGDDELTPESRKMLLLSSREWLRNCLKLCTALDYEDERLRDHAKELVAGLDKELGDAEIDDEDEWEGIDSDEEEADSNAEMDQS